MLAFLTHQLTELQSALECYKNKAIYCGEPIMLEHFLMDRYEILKINVSANRELKCERKQVVLYSPAAAVHNTPNLKVENK